MADTEKTTIVVGVDFSDHSFYALEWAIDRFFSPFEPNMPFNLVVIHARPIPTSVLGLIGPGSADVIPLVEADLKKTGQRTVDKARELCHSKGVIDATIEVVEGDARHVICDAVDRHQASMLIVGSHNYGPVKRAILGSVSDHCAHSAHCSVLIVKKPKH